MDVIVTTGITAGGTARQVLNYLNIPNPCLALGGDAPWLYPEVPPPVDLTMVQLPDPLGYIPITRRIPVVVSSTGTIATAVNERWSAVSPGDFYTLRAANCRHVLIEAAITHNQLPVSLSKYQTVGLWLDCAAPVTAAYTAGSPTGYLDLVQHLGELPKTADVVHIVQMIREF